MATTAHFRTCLPPARTVADFRKLKQALLPKPRLNQRLRYFQTLSNAARLQIAHLLYAKKQLCVCDLATTLGLSSSAISQHLRRMRDCGLVESHRHGQTIYYRLSDPHFCQLIR